MENLAILQRLLHQNDIEKAKVLASNLSELLRTETIINSSGLKPSSTAQNAVTVFDVFPSSVKASNTGAKQVQGVAESKQLTTTQNTLVCDAEDQTFASKKTGQKCISVEAKTGGTIDDGKVNNSNTKEGNWNVVSSRKSPIKQVVSPRQQNSGVRLNISTTASISNTFEALEVVDEGILDSTTPKDDMMNKQIVECSTSEKGDQDSDKLAQNLVQM